MDSKSVSIEQVRAQVSNFCMQVTDLLTKEEMMQAYTEPEWFRARLRGIFSRSTSEGHPSKPKLLPIRNVPE